jgi:hypothetical protein
VAEVAIVIEAGVLRAGSTIARWQCRAPSPFTVD